MPPLVVHMIANSHIDPVWFWPWPSGLDEVLNTFRTGCDMLDAYPDLVLTKGEAWAHREVERLDPELFERIRAHVASGRWRLVGGWWIQPDCNLPAAESFRMQGELGQAYFREAFGQACTVGWNVDSFGHHGMLPAQLREAGMPRYVFMRPMDRERTIPSNLFRWRGADGAEVTAFRIAFSYSTQSIELLEQNLEENIRLADREIGHTMCLFGVGDHGGGPTRKLVEWIADRTAYREDVELRFSHPEAFFDAVETGGAGALPVVRGELQMHAVGCYSVVREIKRENRRAEELVLQAETALAAEGEDAAEEERARLRGAWERICFNQFHDILAGTSIESAYEHARDELGEAKAVARDIVVRHLRRRLHALPDAKHQRLLVKNVSDRPFDGLVEFEPWFGYDTPRRPIRLVDPEGNTLPMQAIQGEACMHAGFRLLFPAALPAGGELVLEAHHDAAAEAPPPAIGRKGDLLTGHRTAAVGGEEGLEALRFENISLLRPGGARVAVYAESSDTWSHDIAGFDEPRLGVFRGEGGWTAREEGPLRTTLFRRMRCEGATLLWQSILEDEPGRLRLRLRLTWSGAHRVAKLELPFAHPVTERIDGCPGGELARPLDGREYPFHHFTWLKGASASLAAVSADVFGLDVTPEGTIRLTLARSPLYIHHDPFVLPADGAHTFPATDQGDHVFDIALLGGAGDLAERIRTEIARQAAPVHVAETTRGMPPREAPARLEG